MARPPVGLLAWALLAGGVFGTATAQAFEFTPAKMGTNYRCHVAVHWDVRTIPYCVEIPAGPQTATGSPSRSHAPPSTHLPAPSPPPAPPRRKPLTPRATPPFPPALPLSSVDAPRFPQPSPLYANLAQPFPILGAH